MPKAARRTSGPTASSNRTNPYPKTSPKTKNKPKSATDKENVDPNPSSSSSPTEHDYRAIELEEINGEIPCYDNATTVRRKLNKLITDKGTIPGTDGKKWNKTSMVAEMQELEKRGHAVEYGKNAVGPTVGSLGKFLKKSGEMGGGDSPCYYWGNALLEKLRIYDGKKKSKSQLEAEKQLPNGHKRWDPKNVSMICGPGLPRPSVAELNHAGR